MWKSSLDSLRWTLEFAAPIFLMTCSAVSAQTAHSRPILSGPAGGLSTEAIKQADLLLGIIHYTRWPWSPIKVLLCLNEADPTSNALISALERQDHQSAPVVQAELRKLGLASPELLSVCDALYVGAMPRRQWNPLLRRLNPRPMLTIGQGEDFCSYGGQFCLITGVQGLQIRANVDAIALSGLRVNARLLQMTARPMGEHP